MNGKRLAPRKIPDDVDFDGLLGRVPLEEELLVAHLFRHLRRRMSVLSCDVRRAWDRVVDEKAGGRKEREKAIRNSQQGNLAD